MKFKIRTKIVIISTLLYTTLLLILGSLVLYDIYHTFADIYDAKLNTYLDVVENNIDEFLVTHNMIDFGNFDSLTPKVLDNIHIEIYDSQFKLLSKPNSALQDEIRSFFFKKDRDSICALGKEETCYHFVEREKQLGKEKIYIAGVISIIEADTPYLGKKFLIIGLVPIAILLITIISFQLSKFAFRPVKKMVNEVNLIRVGNTHQRISVPKPKDEIQELGTTLNKMLDSIEESMISQKKFIENASHEIKTPLTVIRTRLEMISASLNDMQHKTEMEDLICEIDKLAELSRSLLTLARLDADSTNGSKIIVRLDELIVDVVKKYEAAAKKKNIKLIPTINEVIEFSGYEEKLKSMLANLVDNAIKYSGNGNEVNIILDKKDNSAIVEIRDNGIGIDEKDIPNIFKRFYRSDEIRSEIQGSGLGLSIVEEIAKQHNGNITVNSEVGKGTSVKVVLKDQENAREKISSNK